MYGEVHQATWEIDPLGISTGCLYCLPATACAAAGDAERAFQLYSEMREAKVATDKQVYCVLVSACSKQIERTAAEDR